ncbi:hypothetical protein ACLKA6_006127 [Drosophila palustris]
MEVLRKLAVLFALLFTFTAAEPVYSNAITSELSLGNLLYDAITGELTLPEPNILENLDKCVAKYSWKNLEILINAGIKMRECANLNKNDLQNFVQQSSSSGVKDSFKQESIACNSRNCYADLIMNLFADVRPMHKNFWQIQRCVNHELEKTIHNLRKSFISLENCLDWFHSSLECNHSKLELDTTYLEHPKLELDTAYLEHPKLELDTTYLEHPKLELDTAYLEHPKLELDTTYLEHPKLELDTAYLEHPKLELDTTYMEHPKLELDTTYLEHPKLELDTTYLEHPKLELDTTYLEHPKLELDTAYLELT